jgi:hypothetical protein
MTDVTGMTAANPTAHETLRKGDYATVAAMLQSQRIRTVDLSTQGRKLWVANGNLIVQGVDPVTELGVDGVTTTDVNGTYALGEIALESMAARLDLPRNHLKQWRRDKTDLFDTVAGYYLRGEMNGEPSPYTQPDNRVHTLRLLTAVDGENNEVDGMVRAMLGGTYLAIDNLDMLDAVSEGMYAAGVDPTTCKIEADLTESRMVIKAWVPALSAIAPDVLGGYRSPFTGNTGKDVPTVFAGIVFSDSEVGRGAWAVAPRFVYEVCTNGQTITKDAVKKRHAGERLENDGVITWTSDTQKKNLDLITAKTRDVVSTFLNVDYLKTKLAETAALAGAPVKAEDAEQTITRVTRHTGHSSSKSAVMNMFIQGGQYTAGGVMQAYTAAAQVARSGDTAFDLENSAMGAMEYAASIAR